MIRLGGFALLVGCVLLFAVSAHEHGIQSALWGWATFVGLLLVVTGIILLGVWSEKAAQRRDQDR